MQTQQILLAEPVMPAMDQHIRPPDRPVAPVAPAPVAVAPGQVVHAGGLQGVQRVVVGPAVRGPLGLGRRRVQLVVLVLGGERVEVAVRVVEVDLLLGRQVVVGRREVRGLEVGRGGGVREPGGGREGGRRAHRADAGDGAEAGGMAANQVAPLLEERKVVRIFEFNFILFCKHPKKL